MSVAPEPSPESADPPTAPLVSTGNSDRCSMCAAHMATDQRYCVECGTRRGAPRFSLVSQAAPAAPVAAAGSDGAASRFLRSSGLVLLTGLLIILIALGVGVLIGHNNNPKANKTPISVVVNGGGTSGASSGTSASTGSSSTGSSSTGSAASSTGSTAKSSSKAAKSPTKKATAAAAATNPNAAATGKSGTAAAAKTFSTTATKKSTLGGSCTPGTTGCSSTGKQTGNLF